MAMPTSKLNVVLRALEVILFGFALFMCIPPAPSEEAHVYGFLPVALIGGSALFASLVLAVRRGAENWLTALLKLGFYLLLVYALQMRVLIRTHKTNSNMTPLRVRSGQIGGFASCSMQCVPR